MAKNKTLQKAREAYNRSKSTKYRIDTKTGKKLKKKKEQKTKSHYGQADTKNKKITGTNAKKALSKNNTSSKPVKSHYGQVESKTHKTTANAAKTIKGVYQSNVKSAQKNKSKVASSHYGQITPVKIQNSTEKAKNKFGVGTYTGVKSASKGLKTGQAKQSALEEKGKRKLTTVTAKQLKTEQNKEADKAARAARFMTNPYVATGQMSKKDADKMVRDEQTAARKAVKEGHTLEYTRAPRSTEYNLRVQNASHLANTRVVDKEEQERAKREAAFYAHNQIARGEMTKSEAKKLIREAAKGHYTSAGNIILDNLGGKGTAEDVGRQTAGKLAESKFFGGALQGSSYGDITRGVGKYNQQAKELIDTTKQSGAFNAGYMVGQGAQFLLGGTNKMTDALIKGVTKAGTARSALNIGVRKGISDAAVETPLNVLDAIKMATDSDGNIDRAALKKYIGLNTLLSGGVGGAIGGFGSKMTKANAKEYLDISAKLQKGIATDKELSRFNALQTKFNNIRQGNDVAKTDIINRADYDAEVHRDVFSKSGNANDALAAMNGKTTHSEKMNYAATIKDNADAQFELFKAEREALVSQLKDASAEKKVEIRKQLAQNRQDLDRVGGIINVAERELEISEKRNRRAVQNLAESARKMKETTGVNYRVLNDKDMRKAISDEMSRQADKLEARLNDFSPSERAEVEKEIKELRDGATDEYFYKGFYYKNAKGETEILINSESPQAHQTVIGHETGHLIKTSNEKEFFKLGKQLEEYAKKAGDWDAVYNQLKRSYPEATRKELREEVTCELLGRYVYGKDDAFIKQLAGEQPSVLKQIVDYIKKLLSGTTDKEMAKELQAIIEKTEGLVEKINPEAEVKSAKKSAELVDTLTGIQKKAKEAIDELNPDAVAKSENGEYNGATEVVENGRGLGNEEVGRSVAPEGRSPRHVSGSDNANAVRGERGGNERMVDGEPTKLSKENVAKGDGDKPWSISKIVDDDKNVTEEANDAYLKAAESGDLETAQKFIDNLAEIRFPDTVVRYKNGRLKKQHHGTILDFDIFMSRSEMGNHFGTKSSAVDRVGRGKGVRFIEAYLDIKKPIVFDKDLGSWDARYRVTDELHQMGILTDAEYDSLKKSATNKNLQKVLQDKGYDGIQYPNWYEGSGTSYIVFDPKQIKSADAVTRDNGEIIPLSKRYDPINPKYKYSKERKAPIEENAEIGYNNTGGKSNGEIISEGTEDIRRTSQEVREDAERAGEGEVRGGGEQNATVSSGGLGRNAISDDARQALAKHGEKVGHVVDRSTEPEPFIEQLQKNAKSQKFGVAVDSDLKPEDLKGAKLYTASMGNVTIGVKPDGDIFGLAKNTASRDPQAFNDAMFAALANGGVKMDNYGRHLTNMYSQFGFEPVARLAYNPEYVSAEAKPAFDEMIKRGITPDVYVMKHNGDSLEEIARKRANGEYKTWTQDELDALKTFEDYDEALSYRDGLLNEASAPKENPKPKAGAETAEKPKRTPSANYAELATDEAHRNAGVSQKTVADLSEKDISSEIGYLTARMRNGKTPEAQSLREKRLSELYAEAEKRGMDIRHTPRWREIETNALIKNKGYGYEEAQTLKDEIAKLKGKRDAVGDKMQTGGDGSTEGVAALAEDYKKLTKELSDKRRRLDKVIKNSKTTFDEGKGAYKEFKERGLGNKGIKVNKTKVQEYKETLPEGESVAHDFWTTTRRLFETSLIAFENQAKAVMKTNKKLGQDMLAQINNVIVARNIAAAWVQEATTNTKGAITGKSLNDVFKVKYQGKEVDLLKNSEMRNDFSNYMYFKHALAREKVDKEVFGKDFTSADAIAAMEDLKAQYGEDVLEKFSDSVKGYIDSLNEFRVDMGLISKAQLDELNALYPDYVPTYRVGKGDASNLYDLPNYASIDNGIKMAKGSDAEIEDLYLQLAKITDKTIKSGHQNKMFAMYADSMGLKPKDVPKEASAEDMARSQIIADRSKDGSWNVSYYRDGEHITVPVDKQIAKGLREWNVQDKRAFISLMSYGAKITKPYKALITDLNLIFGARNGMRDAQQALVNSKDSWWYAKSIPSAGIAVKNKDNAFRKLYDANGGKWSSIAQLSNLDDIAKINRGGLRGSIDKGIGFIEDINGAIEMMPRMSEFIGTIQKEADKILKNDGSSIAKFKKGIEEELRKAHPDMDAGEFADLVEKEYADRVVKLINEKGGTDNIIALAMRNASDITVNFSRSGVITKGLNIGVVPYLNPSVQGLSKTMRMFSEGKANEALFNFMWKMTMLTTAPAVINEILCADNEAYQSLNTRDKDSNFLIPMSIFGGDKNTFIKFPKPRENSVLAEPAEYFARFLMDRVEYGSIKKGEYANLDEFKQMFVSAQENVGIINIWEDNLFSPLWKTAKNETWYGGAIESRSDMYDENNNLKAPSERYDETTSPAAIWIGQQIGRLTEKAPNSIKGLKFVEGVGTLSPKKIDNLMDSYLGMIYDLGISQMSEKQKTDLKGDPLKRNPVFAQFIKDSVFSNKTSTQFWNKAEKLNSKYGEKSQKYQSFMSKYGYDSFTYDNAISDVDTMDLTPKEKVQMKRELRSMKNQLMERALADKPIKYDPMQRIINLYNRHGIENATDKALSTFAYGGHKEAYDYLKSTKDYRNASAAKQKEMQEHFLDVYKGIKRIQRKTDGSDSFVDYSTAVYSCVKNGYEGGLIANAYCVKSKEWSVEKMIKRTKEYIDAGYTENNFCITIRALNEGARNLKDENKKYSSELDDYDKAMILAEKGYRDGAYFITSQYLDKRMNAARCLTDGHPDGKWTDKKINKFCTEYSIKHDKNYQWDLEQVADAINDKYKGKSDEEKAAVFTVITGNTSENPFGEIGDYKHGNDSGLFSDEDEGKKGRGRRRGRRGWGRGGGGGGGGGSTPFTPVVNTAGKSAKTTDVKASNPFKSSRTTSSSNLDEAYRKRARKLLRKSRKA